MFAVSISIRRYSSGTKQTGDSSVLLETEPIIDSSDSPMVRTATIGVAGSFDDVVVRFKAPLSRKPDWWAAVRTSWACWRDAVRIWRIYCFVKEILRQIYPELLGKRRYSSMIKNSK